MKIMSIAILLILFSSGCITDIDPEKDDKILFRGITTAEVPPECSDYKDDVCALFDCMVDRCWCDDSSPESPVIYEPTGVVITNEDEAKKNVMQYLNDNDLEYKIENCIQLNSVFFNVFASDENDDEVVYTVAADGTIIMTICGV